MEMNTNSIYIEAKNVILTPLINKLNKIDRSKSKYDKDNYESFNNTSNQKQPNQIKHIQNIRNTNNISIDSDNKEYIISINNNQLENADHATELIYNARKYSFLSHIMFVL